MRGNPVYFAVPSAKRYENDYYKNNAYDFVTISVTGRQCAYRCAHCNRVMLQGMLPAGAPDDFKRLVQNLHRRGCKGLLLSGGADESGRVPLSSHLDGIREAARLGMRVVAHGGLLDESTAYALREAGVEQVTMDIIGSEQTIHEVYHLSVGVAAYEQAMINCERAGLSYSPHIVIGLHFSQLLGEEEAFAMIRHYHPQRVVFVVLTPQKHTDMALLPPPPVEEVSAFLAMASARRGDLPLVLGCARPAGAYKRIVEQKAVDLGFRAIAYPDKKTIDDCRRKGIAYEFEAQCCCLL